MLPPNVVGTETDSGPEGFIVDVPIPFPAPHPGYKWSFDLSGYGEDLRDQLATAVQGYALGVRKGGEPVYASKNHWARTPADGSEDWTLDRNMHVASLSKMITAAAMTKVLDEKKISYDAPIKDYLPAYWIPLGQSVDKITFRELMTHTSGFVTKSTGSSDFQLMKEKVLAGVTSIGTYKYENMNFGICRILLAVITGKIDRDTLWPEANDTSWDFVTIHAYANYVAEHVFDRRVIRQWGTGLLPQFLRFTPITRSHRHSDPSPTTAAGMMKGDKREPNGGATKFAKELIT